MACHEEVLEAANAIINKKGGNEFTPNEIIIYLKEQGTAYKESTIRTHIVSRCCKNAPEHHGTRYQYFERISQGLYKLIGIPKDDEKENIIKEINKTGFPLELKISKFLEDEGYFIANNLYYIDQDEGKGREVDMRALKNYEFKAGGKSYFIRHCLIIQCKRSEKKKPWVVFTSPQTIYDRHFFFLQCRGVKMDIKWADYGVPEKMGKIHPFSICKRRGRSFFEPFKHNEGGARIFESLITSVKAGIAIRNNEFGASSNSVCFYYPMVVFDGKLYEAYLDNKNRIKAQEADSVMVSFFYESPKYKDERFIVPIVTERDLPTFCSLLDSMLLFFGKLFENNMNLIKMR